MTSRFVNVQGRLTAVLMFVAVGCQPVDPGADQPAPGFTPITPTGTLTGELNGFLPAPEAFARAM